MFQFYKSTIITVRKHDHVYPIFGFNSTKVRLLLDIPYIHDSRNTSFNSTKVRLLRMSEVAMCAAFASFNSTKVRLLRECCGNRNYDILVSILQKYDYYDNWADLMSSDNFVSILQKYDYYLIWL